MGECTGLLHPALPTPQPSPATHPATSPHRTTAPTARPPPLPWRTDFPVQAARMRFRLALWNMISLAWISMSTAWPDAPPRGWWIMMRALGIECLQGRGVGGALGWVRSLAGVWGGVGRLRGLPSTEMPGRPPPTPSRHPAHPTHTPRSPHALAPRGQ